MSQLAKTIQIEKIVRERDKMLTKLIELQGRLAGIELAIEIVGQAEPEWTTDESGNPMRIIGSDT